MSNRISLTAVGFLAFALLWNGIHSAHSQEARKTALAIGYPNPAIIIDGNNTRYQGIIYTSVYAADHGPGQGGAPVATYELTPSARAVWQLPLGTYEVRYGMRVGSEMKTFIVRDVILRAEGATSLIVEMNAAAKTTIIGGDMSVRDMEDGLRRLTAEIADLKKKVNP